MIPGYLTASWLTSRYGRQRVLLVYVFLAAAGGVAFATATNTFQFYAGDVMLYFFGQGAWGVWDTWVCELYATPLRALGNSWGNAGQRVANTVAPTVVGFFVARAAGFSATVAFIDGFMFITGSLAFYFRETEGAELA